MSRLRFTLGLSWHCCAEHGSRRPLSHSRDQQRQRASLYLVTHEHAVHMNVEKIPHLRGCSSAVLLSPLHLVRCLHELRCPILCCSLGWRGSCMRIVLVLPSSSSCSSSSPFLLLPLPTSHFLLGSSSIVSLLVTSSDVVLSSSSAPVGPHRTSILSWSSVHLGLTAITCLPHGCHLKT